MSKKLVVFEPSGLRLLVDETATILDAARMLGLHISAECGGCCTCGKCLVVMKPVPEPTDAERTHISDSDLQRGIRLACEHSIQEETRVILHQTLERAKILVETGPDHSDWDIDDGLENQKGVAIDVGTTTIVAYLMDMGTGTQVAQAASLNPQVIYGEDVMTRIAHVMLEEEGGKTLREIVLRRIDELILDLIELSRSEIEDITRLSIVGNPAMHHLLLGLDVKSLGTAPYEPVIRHALNTNGKVLGLATAIDASVYIAPNIAGFVGGDTAAFILSQRLHSVDDIVLGIDIGTNGEIVLSVRGELYCCSAAAGSAFEGATIKHGMRGQEGAIEHLSISDSNSAPEVFIIGNTPPKGLCGSAIVDVVAQLMKAGIVDSSGRMLESTRVFEEEGLGRAYTIVSQGDLNSDREIIFTQKDVRQVQLAKGAILAGASILMESAGVGVSDINRILLAGAFGNYIAPESALAIGLLPPVGIEKVIGVGNAAGDGAKRILMSSKERSLMESIVERAHYLELAQHETFVRVFSKATRLDGAMPL